MVVKAAFAAPSRWAEQILDSDAPKSHRRRRLHSSLVRAGVGESDKDVVQDVRNDLNEGASTSRGAGDDGASSAPQSIPFSDYARASGVSITELVTLEPGAFPFKDDDSEEAGPTAEEANAFAVKSGSLLSSTKRGGRGAQVADILYVFGGLLDRPFSDGDMIAKAGRIAIERLQGDVKELFQHDDVDQQLLFELERCLKLLNVHIDLIGAAKKRETLLQRLEEAKVPCRQAMQIAENL
ncbi:hypothetical protein CBR_g19283 [Chara braunii]|uniref:Uncharacterized protein n=1 Tax=Chara braunii TaxID=69332 RepID=A0A388KXK5_CHABU|nr:hypothetical protein CBR_g19283 [Chara braunii]|eukprot:GBG74771.1 hypothetical protein CBR_g19283 [Chara braunii]